MNIKETISVINQMQADGVIGQYAVGGAVAATFFIEPAETKDVDIFVFLKSQAGQLIVTLQPIFEYLKVRGYDFIEEDGVKTEYVNISGWPVQFLPAEKPLLKEALEKSAERNIDDIPVRVFTAEHLAAIALELGRPKDRLRLLQFLQAHVLDEVNFSAILARHNLLEKWTRFQKQMID